MTLINAEQNGHLKLLRENGSEVSIEICKLALDYLNNGRNLKRYQTLANKLKITTDSLQETINALLMLLISSVKSNISEEDFTSATNTAFTPDQISILWQFVTSKREFLTNVLRNYSVQDYRFREMEWRLEARVASRSLLVQSIPIITIKMHLDLESINENKDVLSKSNDFHLPRNAQGNDKVGDKKFAMSSQRRGKKEVLFQTDPNNLVYIIEVLEKALDEAKTHRVRIFTSVRISGDYLEHSKTENCGDN